MRRPAKALLLLHGWTASADLQFFTAYETLAEDVLALGDDLRTMGRDVTFHVYEGTGHPFANEEDPFGTYDANAAALAWTRTLALLDAHL